MRIRVLATMVLTLLAVALVAGPAFAQYPPEEPPGPPFTPPGPPPEIPPSDVLGEIIERGEGVIPVTQEAPEREAPEPAPQATEVLAEVEERTLPVTGTDAIVLSVLGVVLIGLGFLAVRRRGSPDAG